MVGLLLMFFIARAFSELAFENNKSRWGYGILGVLIYYFGTFIGGFIIGIAGIIFGTNIADESSKIVLTLVCVPFGLLLCWGYYKLLGNYWNNKRRILNNEPSDGEPVL
jgi:uncharacterized membrane protein YeiB